MDTATMLHEIIQGFPQAGGPHLPQATTATSAGTVVVRTWVDDANIRHYHAARVNPTTEKVEEHTCRRVGQLARRLRRWRATDGARQWRLEH